MNSNNNANIDDNESDVDATTNDRYSHIDPSILAACAKLASITMKGAFGRDSYSWQRRIVTHLNLMQTHSRCVIPSTTLLCAPTGGGKPLARDTFAAGQSGVSVCICPLLALGADQVSKINAHSCVGDGSIRAYHLDAFKDTLLQQQFCDQICGVSRESQTTIILMTSPHALIRNKKFYEMFLKLLRQKTLTLLTVDELQLFVSFGLRFRPEFYALKNKVFSLLKTSDDSDAETKIPVLFMTAFILSAAYFLYSLFLFVLLLMLFFYVVASC